MDETVPDDAATFVEQLGSRVQSQYSGTMNGGLGNPQVSTGHILRIRYRKTNASAVQANLFLNFDNASGIGITIRQFLDIGTAWTTDVYTLTAAEVAAIEDYNAGFRDRLNASFSGAGAETGVDVTWVEFEVPDATLFNRTVLDTGAVSEALSIAMEAVAVADGGPRILLDIGRRDFETFGSNILQRTIRFKATAKTGLERAANAVLYAELSLSKRRSTHASDLTYGRLEKRTARLRSIYGVIRQRTAKLRTVESILLQRKKDVAVSGGRVKKRHLEHAASLAALSHRSSAAGKGKVSLKKRVQHSSEAVVEAGDLDLVIALAEEDILEDSANRE